LGFTQFVKAVIVSAEYRFSQFQGTDRMNFFFPEPSAVATRPGPIIEWEETHCYLCGSDQWTPLVEAPDQAAKSEGLWFAVVQCKRCGLCFTNPRPSPSSIGQFYHADYEPHQPRKLSKQAWFGPPLNSRKRRHRDRRLELPWHGQGRLLDFGCGRGSFMQRMHERGWKVTGLDFSARAVHRIQNHLGLPTLLGSLPHPELAPKSFDVITMWQSLEHVHHPQEILRQANELLVSAGRLFVAVPNIDSQAFRWFGPAWYGLDLPRHLTHFSPVTLQVMIERAGFQVLSVRMVRHSSWLRASARLTCRFPSKARWRRLLVNRFVSRLAAWYSYWMGQSDCIVVEAVKS